MKKLKKLITLCLVFALICTSALAYDAGTLNYLGVVPDGVTDNATVTREILSYSLSKVLMPGAEYEGTDTAFYDVKADNAYSGYIKYISDRGIMNGSGDGMFNPKANITFNELSTVLVKALGYGVVAEAKGGWPAGYNSVAASLKLYSGVDLSSGTISFGALKAVLLNLLDVSVPEETISTQNGSYEFGLTTSGDNLSYAEKNLDLCEYEGVVTDIDFSAYKATVTFSEQSRDGRKYDDGDVKIFDVSETVNIAYYKNLPARFVIYNDKLIVDAVLEDGVEVSYGVVDSVNNETDDTGYNVSHLNALTIEGDDDNYSFADDCIFVYNNENYSGKLSLMGKYVKLALRDDEILSISLYDLKDGGRIVGTAADHIDYNIGSTPRRLGKIKEVEELIVIIDGESRGYSELKADMLFSYWLSADEKALAIIASDKQLSDVLHGINSSDMTLSLGNQNVNYTKDIYSSPDNKIFTEGDKVLLDYCGTDVTVSLDIYNKARYVISYDLKGSVGPAYGYVLGYEAPQLLYGAKIRMACLNEPGAPIRDFAIGTNVTLNDKSDISGVIASAGSTDGSALYEVEYNSKDEIISFKSPTELKGFEGTKFEMHSIPSGWIPVAGRKILINGATPLLCIGSDDGDAVAYALTFSAVSAKTYEDAYTNQGKRIQLRMYSYDGGESIGMVLMTGDIDAMPSEAKTGIVDRVGKGKSADGEITNSITIEGATYILSEKSSIVPEAGELVSYSESLFKPGEVSITRALNYKKDLSTWNGASYGADRTFRTGTVVRADQSKIVIALDEAYNPSDALNLNAGDEYLCFYESGCKFYGIDSKGVVTKLEARDISPDMETAILVWRNKNYLADSVEQVYVRID